MAMIGDGDDEPFDRLYQFRSGKLMLETYPVNVCQTPLETFIINERFSYI